MISVAVSPDERFIASASLDGTMRVWDARTNQTINKIEPKTGSIDAVAFSPDGKFIATGGEDKTISLWNADNLTLVRAFKGPTDKILSVSFSSDGQKLISSGQDKIVRLWNVAGGSEIREFPGHVAFVGEAVFLPGDKFSASASEDGNIIVWNNETGSRLVSLVSLRDGVNWLVTTPDGFFDGSQPAWKQISWRFENNTFNIKSVEEFFSEFWLPGLLSDILNNRKLPTSTSISAKDRRQPKLKMSVTGPQNGQARFVNVSITVADAPAGAKDVRLFRNGALVKVWRDDVMKGRTTAVLEEKVPIVAGENRLTVYAFNSDDIKSRDETYVVKGPAELARKGILYVLAIGVNEYENAAYNLTYAVDDANEFAAEFKRQQAGTERIREYRGHVGCR